MIDYIKLIEILAVAADSLRKLDEQYEADKSNAALVEKCHRICEATGCYSLSELAASAEKFRDSLERVNDTATGPWIELRLFLPFQGLGDFL